MLASVAKWIGAQLSSTPAKVAAGNAVAQSFLSNTSAGQQTRASGEGRWARGANFVANAGWAYDSIRRFTGDLLPSYQEGCEVVVYGGPTSKKSDLKKLALAIAFGRAYPPKLSAVAQQHNLQIDIDEVNKIARVRYTWAMGGIFASSIGDATTTYGLTRMVADSPEELTGKEWAWPYEAAVKIVRGGYTGIGVNSLVSAASGTTVLSPGNLNGSDKIILTDKPAPNLGPTFDTVSRSTDLSIAFAQALEYPGEALEQPSIHEFAVNRKPNNNIQITNNPNEPYTGLYIPGLVSQNKVQEP